MAKKKRKSGNPRNSTPGGRVRVPPCRVRSAHQHKETPCKFSSPVSVDGGPVVHRCSWCGATSPRSPKIPATRGPKPEEVPDNWFSDEEPVVAVSIPKWQNLHRQGPSAWPPVARETFLRRLNDEQHSRHPANRP